MFGKGVYFADAVSKSANYCFTSPSNNTGVLLLCEVALGGMNELLQSSYTAANLPPGKLSTWGKGRSAPDAKDNTTLDDGTLVPLGKIAPTNVQGGSLLYNEFIVYNVAQIRIKYLMRVKFNYK
jgi:poly [ADP-ribose] polymerase